MHWDVVEVTREPLRNVQSDALVFHCNTCDTDWPPSSQVIANIRKQFSKSQG